MRGAQDGFPLRKIDPPNPAGPPNLEAEAPNLEDLLVTARELGASRIGHLEMCVRKIRLGRRRDIAALVDEADFNLVGQYRWYADPNHNSFYAMRYWWEGDVQRWQAMHTLLLPGGMVDHRNGNGLDNRRENLRLATPAQNSWNARPRTGGTSQFKGVYWHKGRQRWLARIMQHGHRHQLGEFRSEEDAARAYDEAALRLFGEFARINFPVS